MLMLKIGINDMSTISLQIQILQSFGKI